MIELLGLGWGVWVWLFWSLGANVYGFLCSGSTTRFAVLFFWGEEIFLILSLKLTVLFLPLYAKQRFFKTIFNQSILSFVITPLTNRVISSKSLPCVS